MFHRLARELVLKYLNSCFPLHFKLISTFLNHYIFTSIWSSSGASDIVARNCCTVRMNGKYSQVCAVRAMDMACIKLFGIIVASLQKIH
jgi:hypothetical protein